MTPTDTRSAPKVEDEIDLLGLLSTLWAGKFLIALAVVVALLIGTFTLLRTPSLYQAQGVLQLESKSGALSLPAGMQDLLGTDAGGSKSAGATEIEIMKSRMVMSQVVQELDLQIQAQPRKIPVLGLIPARLHLPDTGLDFLSPYQWGNELIEVGELEVPEAWLGAEMVLTITGTDSYALTLPDGHTAEGKARERLGLADQGFSLVVDKLQGPMGRQFILTRIALSSAVQTLQANFSVTESPSGSSILQVSYTDPKPQQAERILDAISQAYLNQNVSRSAAEAENSIKFINEQLPVAEKSVTDAQDALNTYRQQQKSVDLDYETRTLLERATAIEGELNALALKEKEIKDSYTVNHPIYKALLQNRATLEAQLADLKRATANLPETQKEVFNLNRNLEVSQQVYVQLLNRQQELQVVKASTVGSVRIIDTAYSNGIRISPVASRTLALYLVAGFALGAGFVLLRRALHRGIRSAQEIDQIGVPTFATVNFATEAASFRKAKGRIPIFALSNPQDLTTEAFRSLRTSLHFGMLDAQTNTVLLTSASPGAGKSFNSVNLAVVAAQAGQKVCLIDADMRKGYLRRYFGKEKGTPGLAELLAREKSLDEVMFQGPVETLSVITSGRLPPNPSELLMRVEFQDLLKALNERFDLIIIDSPPALAVTDPVVIGRYVGATIIVTRHMETMIGEVEAVRRAFDAVGAKVTGAILNGYKESEGGKYGGNYKYYNYRYSYKSDQQTEL
ncbi:MAG: acetyltransferase [Rhodobacterales bacterium 17-64-5]|nr:MAG: acetyltransferase [Rhodobacterales bacterium 17-64-5]